MQKYKELNQTENLISQWMTFYVATTIALTSLCYSWKLWILRCREKDLECYWKADSKFCISQDGASQRPFVFGLLFMCIFWL